MPSSRFERLRRLFDQASSLNGEGRVALIERVRADDADLACELESLLERDHSGRGTIEGGVAAAAHEAFEGFGDATSGPPAPAAPVASAPPDAARAIVERLAGRSALHERYRVEGEFARGGMGVILRVFDEDLHRPLAMKVQRRPEGPDGRRAMDRSLGRFLEEAQVTGQLEHPGIVPVHDLGTNADGNVYFTMKLVQGRDLKEIIGLVPTGAEGWSTTRVVRIVHRVCEAMAYAHAKGVIHRDLKPANVMVGRFGEVYVMDWGLARVDGDEGAAGQEGALDATRAFSELRASETPDTGQLTHEGDILGTPSYMPPEQAYGRAAEIGPAADVYAIGAILYHLFAGHPPYAGPGESRSPSEVLMKLIAGPPASLDRVAPDTPAELASICEKAMARNARERYPGVAELGADVEAWLEGRVVTAHEAGAWAEARKWVLRNRGLAVSAAAALVIAIGGLAGISYTQSEGRRLAEAERKVAVRQRNNVLRLSAIPKLDEIERDAAQLWPARENRLGDFDDWLERARDLVAGLEPDPQDPEDIGHRAALAELHALRVEDPTRDSGWRYPDERTRWWTEQLEHLVARFEAFADDGTGLAGHGVSKAHGAWGVARRREWAATIRERSITGAAARRRWNEAIRSIGSPIDCPAYDGLQLDPQLGLLPIGRNSASGLWEFAHLATGEPATRVGDGTTVVGSETGLVFVLVPGGWTRIGAQSDDRSLPYFDAGATSDEGPPHDVQLPQAYFIAKHEMTIGQWERLTGRRPIGSVRWQPTAAHPVEGVTWLECAELLARLGPYDEHWGHHLFGLPTEAQWEHAARASTKGTWYTGNEAVELQGAVNLADRTAESEGGSPDWSFWDDADGQVIHAPVGSYSPNPFGLHDIYGNVEEYCRDAYSARFYMKQLELLGLDPWAAEDGGIVADSPIVTRGGSYQDHPTEATSAMRKNHRARDSSMDRGLRPMRYVE